MMVMTIMMMMTMMMMMMIMMMMMMMMHLCQSPGESVRGPGLNALPSRRSKPPLPG